MDLKFSHWTAVLILIIGLMWFQPIIFYIFLFVLYSLLLITCGKWQILIQLKRNVYR